MVGTKRYLALGLAAALAVPAPSEAATRRVTTARPSKQLTPRPVARRTVKLSRLGTYESLTKNLQATAAERAANDAAFKQLPAEHQDQVLAAVQPAYAMQVELAKPKTALKFDIAGKIVQLAPPAISRIYPDEGERGKVAVVQGTLFNGNCVVNFNGVERSTSYVWGLLVFEVPSNTPLGNRPLFVKDKARNKVSGTVQFKIVAPRGYRGVHGWKFANFGTPTISWAVFRDYFGANEVEYGNGTHRPAAQAWYDSSYKGIGAGGDCYGMSMRSIRTRRNDWRGNYSSWWPAHKEDRVWDYAKTNEVVESVRWDQGGQLCAQAAAIINDRWNNQSANAAFTLIKNAIAAGGSNNQPIMGMWRVPNGGGHAVVAYKVEEVGNDQKIVLWDNNKPYSETEANDNNSLAHVYKNTNSFTYGNYNKLASFKYSELNYADPNLPASAAGGMGLADDTVVVVCEDPNAVKQLTDEKGRTFFAGGKENTNSKTRIADAMRFVPLTGGELPADYPAIFIFNKAKNKSITVELNAGADTNLRSFGKGRVAEVQAKKGKVLFDKLLTPAASVGIIDPTFTQPKKVGLIEVQADGAEQVFEVMPKGALGKKALHVGFDKGLQGITIDNKDGASTSQFDLKIKAFSKTGALQEKLQQNLDVPAGKKGLLKISNFSNLGAQQLKMNLLVPKGRSR